MSDAGLVLAAGRSSRFGPEDKLLADLGGRPLAAHAAAAMAGTPLDRRIVVVGSESVAALFPGFEVVLIDNAETGQAESLRAGVAAADGSGRLLIALADMPFVTAAHLEAVLARCGAEGSASHDGARPMPPACFPASRFAALMALTGDRGAGGLLRHLPPEALVAAPEGMLMDIDTPEALDRARGRT